MAQRAGCSFTSIYDIVASYIRVCVGAWAKECGKDFDPKGSIPVLETDYDNSELTACLKEFSCFVNKYCTGQIQNVRAVWLNAFRFMSDLTVPIYRHYLRGSFYAIAVSWLISDGHYLSWERIVVAMQMAAGVVVSVFQAETAHKTLKDKRMQDMVHVCAQFFEAYFSKWLSENGGWEGIVLLKELLMKQQTQDIPYAMPPCGHIPGEYSIGNIINKDLPNSRFPDAETFAHEEMLTRVQGPYDTDVNKRLTRHEFYSESDRKQRNEDTASRFGLQFRKYKSESDQTSRYADQRRRDIERQVRLQQQDQPDPLHVAFDLLNIE